MKRIICTKVPSRNSNIILAANRADGPTLDEVAKEITKFRIYYINRTIKEYNIGPVELVPGSVREVESKSPDKVKRYIYQFQDENGKRYEGEITYYWMESEGKYWLDEDSWVPVGNYSQELDIREYSKDAEPIIEEYKQSNKKRKRGPTKKEVEQAIDEYCIGPMNSMLEDYGVNVYLVPRSVRVNPIGDENQKYYFYKFEDDKGNTYTGHYSFLHNWDDSWSPFSEVYDDSDELWGDMQQVIDNN